MLNAVIIDEDGYTSNQFINTLFSVEEDVKLLARLSSVQESLIYFSRLHFGDIIFCEVELADGLAFEIFDKVSLSIPVIFVNATDQHMTRSFAYNAIDYLLKPVHEYDLQKALLKYHKLKEHFTHHPPITEVQYNYSKPKKTRLIARKGMENISLRLEDIVLFYTENKIVYIIDQNGKKYMADRPLAQIHEELDPGLFYRANRQYIINVNFIRGFKAHDKVKLLVELTPPDIHHNIIVSQEKAPEFRQWIYSV
jgi:DNA-binding LytR/AlgR family response regulator